MAKSRMMCDSVSWDVIMPGRRARMGAPQPKGSIRICTEAGDVSYKSVPASVARAMARKKKAGELADVTQEDLYAALRDCTISCAKTRIAKTVTRRDYSHYELSARLSNDGFESDVAQEALNWSLDVGLVNDMRFADSFVRSKISAGWGVNRIERELQNKGIDPYELQGWPHDYLDPDGEFERALEIAKRRHVRGPNAYAKVVRFLASRGFSYGIATRVASHMFSETDQSI